MPFEQATQNVNIKVVESQIPGSPNTGNLIPDATNWLTGNITSIILAAILLAISLLVAFKFTPWLIRKLSCKRLPMALKLGRFSPPPTVSRLVRGGIAALIFTPAFLVSTNIFADDTCTEPICVTVNNSTINVTIDKNQSGASGTNITASLGASLNTKNDLALPYYLASWLNNPNPIFGQHIKLVVNEVSLTSTAQDIYTNSGATTGTNALALPISLVINSETPIGDYTVELVYQVQYDYRNEQILFTINTTDGNYNIPTSGRVANMNHVYDWDVEVDNQPVTASNAATLSGPCVDGNCKGTSGITLPNADGIALTNLTNGQHQIKITAHEGASLPGWGNAFGHPSVVVGVANAAVNRAKLISIDAPLTTLAFAPKTSESTTNASLMFSDIFRDCINLTAPATFLGNYVLPSTITNLSYFLVGTHFGNTGLTQPIDLTPFKDWFSGNENITNLGHFLVSLHGGDSGLARPIDFTPLKDWFTSNQSIISLSNFLGSVHSGNSNLAQPIDLTPFKNWFKDNESINNLDGFLYGTHSSNTGLTRPIDLTPLEDWLKNNESVTNLGGFLYNTHSSNTGLTQPINLIPLKDWFKDNESVTNLSHFLNSTHGDNTNLVLNGQTIFPNWIKTIKQSTTPVYEVSNSFYRMFYGTKTDNSVEPTFEDDTPLSSIGTPNSDRQTYYGTNITPVNSNWK
ncbi:MAG: hypothetical protein LBH36_02805 [Candidatus Nomurabacteria bacterium]|jgi:hypothetical protein|nr:hypothetical protein [Candidatus Nomurabacteria bacterium]